MNAHKTIEFNDCLISEHEAGLVCGGINPIPTPKDWLGINPLPTPKDWRGINPIPTPKDWIGINPLPTPGN